MIYRNFLPSPITGIRKRALALVVMLLTVLSASALEKGIWIGGKKIDTSVSGIYKVSDNSSYGWRTGQVTWDANKKELTLYDFRVTTTNGPALQIVGMDLCVVHIGYCLFENKSGIAFYVCDSKVRFGESGPYSFTALEFSGKFGIVFGTNSSVNSDTRVSVNSTYYCLMGEQKGYGSLHVNHPLKLASSVSAVNNLGELTTSDSYGITSSHGAHFYDGQIWNKYHETQLTTVTYDEVDYYGFKICGTPVNGANYDCIDNYHFPNAAFKGNISYNSSTNELSLGDKSAITNYSTWAPTIENPSNDGLEIVLGGDVDFKYANQNQTTDALSIERNTTLISDGQVKLSLTTAQAPKAGGIRVVNSKLSMDGKWNQGGLLSVETTCIYGKSKSEPGELELLLKANVKATGSSNGTVRFMKVALQYPSSYGTPVASTVSSPAFFWKDGPKGAGVYKNQTDLATGEVNLVFPSTQYKLWVNGEVVNSNNKDNILFPGLTSGRVYATGENALTLANAVIDGNACGSRIIEFNSSNTGMLTLTGTNTVKDGNTTTEIYHKNQKEALAIIGGGTLKGTSLDINAGYMVVSGNGTQAKVGYIRTTELAVSSATIEADNIRNNGNTDDLHTVKTALSNCVVESTEKLPAYYDNGNLTAKTGVRIIPKPSNFTDYNLRVGPVAVNSANKDFIWWPDVTSGRIYYDGSKWLVLNNATVKYTGTRNLIHNSAIDGLQLRIDGINQIECASAPFFVTYKNAEFWGLGNGGRLNVTGTTSATPNAGSVNVLDSKTLTISSSNVSYFLPSIDGGSSGKLVVNTPVVLWGSPQGTLANMGSITLNGLEAITKNTMVKLDVRNDAVYDTNGNIYKDFIDIAKSGTGIVLATGVTLNKTTLSFANIGATERLTATVSPSNATYKTVTWYTDGVRVATVSSDGVVTAVGEGTCNITARDSEGHEAKCRVTVSRPAVQSVTLSQSDMLLTHEGDNRYIRATVSPTDANQTVTWTVSDPTVVELRVGTDCGIYALKEGEAEVTATVGGQSATCHVKVQWPVPMTSLTLLADGKAVKEVHLKAPGQTIQFSANYTPSNATNTVLTWGSNTVRTGTIDENGLFTALDYGGTVVYASANDGSGMFEYIRVYVDRPPVPATSVEVAPWTVRGKYLGETIQLQANVTPENADRSQMEWWSSNPNRSKVDQNGLVTTVSYGDCDIFYGIKDNAQLRGQCSVIMDDPDWYIAATDIAIEGETEITILQDEPAHRVYFQQTPINANSHAIWNGGDPDNQEFLDCTLGSNASDEYGRSYLDISPREGGRTGTVNVTFCPSSWDYEACDGVAPTCTLKVNVVDPIFFTENSVEGIPVKYHVTDLATNACEVYAEYDEMMPEFDPELEDDAAVPAIPETAEGKLTIPSKAGDYWVTHISARAFQKCTGITEVEIEEGVRSIGAKAFSRKLTSLTKVTLPSTISELGSECFATSGMDYEHDEEGYPLAPLREVIILAKTPPMGSEDMPIENTSAFYGLPSDAVLYVPAGCKEAYNKMPWIGEVYDAEGDYTEHGWFSRIEELPAYPDVEGDANGDGQVDISDLATVIAYVVSHKTPGTFLKKSADVNHDGKVDGEDIKAISQLLMAAE